jgi:capsular exopolysaccharide synthesis family protein
MNLEKNNTLSLKDITAKYINRWPYFLVGLLLAFICAYIYIQIVPPVYEIKATLLVKDKKKSPEIRSALEELDVSNSPSIVENELGILKSRNLMAKVVSDLQLWTIYREKKGFTSRDLYKESPIKFNLVNPGGGSLKDQKIEVSIKDEKSFLLNTPEGKQIESNFNEIYKSSFGTWKLIPLNNIDEYVGSTITILLYEPDDITKKYEKSFEAFLESKLGGFVNLAISDHVPQRGKDILNGVIQNYNELALAEKDKITQSTIDFIDNRLALMSKELNSAEVEVESFRSSRGLTDISSQSKIYLENVQSNDVKLNEVNVQLSIIEGIERYINSPQSSNVTPAMLGISDEGLNSLIEKLAQLHLQRDQLLATTPADNPVFAPLERQISSTIASIKSNINSIKSSLLSTKRELQSFNSKFESSIRGIPGQERQFLAIKREQTIKEDLYIYLLQKREEVSLSYASTLSDAQIIDNAYTGPIKHPKKLFIYALALLLGLLVPAGFIYGKDSWKNLVINKNEIEEVTGIPVIAELINVPDQNTLILENKVPNAIGEQLKTLRTKLNYIHEDQQKGRVTLFTSSVVGEGKSFVSSNLSVHIAASGRKTIIINMDLRKPKITEAFNLSSNHLGISDYLNGNHTKEEIIQTSKLFPNLSIIGCGIIPTNPSELLEKEKLDVLISELKEIYHDIILDSPPVHLVTDALILARFTDVTFYMIRQGVTKRTELNFINDLNKQKTLPNIHIVFNGIQRKKYGYGYEFDSSYYTGHK